MDCVCVAESIATDAAVDPYHSQYFIIKQSLAGTKIQALDLAQGLVLNEFQGECREEEGSQVTIGEELVLAAQNTIAVYSLSGAFKGSFVCAGKTPYVLDRVAISKEFLYFSTHSHNNIYACSYSYVSQVIPTKLPLKFKLPKGVTVLSMQQKPGSPVLLSAGCSDGLIRIWTVSTQTEEIGILDPAKDIGLNKKVIKKLITSESYPSINAIDFTIDGGRLLAGVNNGAVNIWRTERLPHTYFLEASLRVSEMGVVANRWLTSQSYAPFGYFLVAIREGTILLLQHSISTVFNPDTDGQKLGLARMFPSKIIAISPSLLTFPPPQSGLWHLDHTLQVTSSCDSFLLCFPCDSGLVIRNMRLLPSSASTELSLPVAAQIGNASVEALEPDKARFFPYAFYLKSNEIWRLSIATGKTDMFLSVSEGQVLVRNFSLSFRPHIVTNSYQFLILKDVKGKRIATFLNYSDGQISQTLFTCHDAVLIGPEEERSGLLVLLAEAQDTVTMLDLNTGGEKAAFVLQGKLLKAVWTPLAGGHAILYETQNDHSLCLSRSALSHNPTDISLDSSLRFRLRFDERVCALSWHRTYLKLCIGTSLRVAVLDHNLAPLVELKHAETCNLASMMWMGNTVLYTTNTGLYYCHPRGSVKLASLPKDSILLHTTNDRVSFLHLRNGDPCVQTRPMMLLEPLLINYLSLPSHSEELVHRLIEKMDTNLVSETLIEALIREKMYAAAVYLIDTHGLPHVAVRCKAEAMLGAKRMEELWKILEINENDRESLRRGSAELHVLSSLSPSLEQLAQISKIATVYHREQSDWQLALLSRETQKNAQISNPFLHLLESPNEPLTLQPKSLTDFSKIAHVFPDRNLTPLPCAIKRAKLGYKEAAFALKTTEHIEIFPISGDTFSQWIGFDSVHEPGIVPIHEAEKDKIEPSGFIETIEEGKLLWYFRLDEGSGDTISDLSTGKTYQLQGCVWGDVLEDGIPLDYEDKWGKAAPPSYAIDCSDSEITLTSLGIPKSFTIELWIYAKTEVKGSLFALDSFIFHIENSLLVTDSKLSIVPDSEISPELPSQAWTHIIISSDSCTWYIYFNTKLAYQRQCPSQVSFDTLHIGPFPGKVTEIRIWTGMKSLSDIRENYRCPLDIVNEKKKKAWSGMTIKKVISAASVPGATGLKLAPPGGKKLGLLPPVSMGKAGSQIEHACDVKPVSVSKQESGPKDDEIATEIESNLSDITAILESGDYAEALLCTNRKLREIAEGIANAEEDRIPKLQAILQTTVAYKLALSLMLRVQSERQQASLEAQQRAAELCNLLIQVKIQPKHRLLFGHLALELNSLAGNYSIALKLSEQLLASKFPLTSTQLSTIQTQRTLCQANETKDNGLLPCLCPTCKGNLPAGNITKKCIACRCLLRFCYHSFGLVSQDTASLCLVCGAVYRRDIKPLGEKCSYCGLAKVVEALFEDNHR